MMELWTFIGALSTLMVFSFFYYKDNPLFRIAQELVTAITLAHFVVTGLQNIDKLALTPIRNGNFIFIIPILLGLGMYLQLVPKYKVFSQWPSAIILGIGLGIGLRGAISTDIGKQVVASFLPLSGGSSGSIVNNLIFIACIILTILYFTFSSSIRKGAVGQLAKTGQYIVLGTMGAIFGVVAMSRFALLIGRISYLLQAFGLL